MSIEKTKDAAVSRRNMLMKLGLAAGAAYMAPVMLKLGEAHASGGSGRGSGGRGSFSGNRRRRVGPRRGSFS